ncbi:MAG: phosphodiester glycosidase family protein [Clostridia bacterium]|nr:phosphodiester glycosidase family protein [Clostridia bacterium]
MKKRVTALMLLGLLLTLLSPALAESGNTVVTADFSDKFADRFLAEGEAPIVEDMAYRSRDVSIEIKTYRENNSDIYVADVYLRSLSALRRGFEGGEWKGTRQRMARITDMALTSNAILALTGDNAHNEKNSIVFENGVMRRKAKPNRQLCVIFMDGEMRTYKSSEITIKKLEQVGKPVWQTFMFGPGLLDEEGHAYKTYKSKVGTANPRAAIGYYEPGHYCLIQVDGRGVKSLLEPGRACTGMTLKELADFMEGLGCKGAYNLDGGQSAMMWFNDRIISNPYKNGRGCGDIVYIPRTE